LIVISSGTREINESLNFEKEKPTIDTNVSGFPEIADCTFNFLGRLGYEHLAAISSIADYQLLITVYRLLITVY